MGFSLILINVIFGICEFNPPLPSKYTLAMYSTHAAHDLTTVFCMKIYTGPSFIPETGLRPNH